jgi:membrane associated rhomboid family serine protease
MIPVGDSLRSRTFPFVNYIIIAVNITVFLYELMLQSQRIGPNRNAPTELDEWVAKWGTVPCRVTDSCSGLNGRFVDQLSNVPFDWVQLLASQFIHGGLLHIAGNMLFLWIFGDNIEDAMGHVRYLVFYLLCGVIAGLAQVASDPNAVVPSVGASGAIAGVLGAYLVTYPRASVQVVIPIIFIPFFTRLPAVLMMGFWFLSQLIGVGSVADVRGGEGGVAYWAHIGGFLAGMALVFFFRGRERSYDVNERYERYRWEPPAWR